MPGVTYTPGPPPVPPFRAVYGVDFSGARLAGRTTWVARLEPKSGEGPPFALTALRPLERLCGTAERAPALASLVETVRVSEGCLWGLGFPFGFPVEVAGPWGGQLELVKGWGDDAYGLGLELVRRTEEGFGRKHLRRLTESRINKMNHIAALRTASCIRSHADFSTVKNSPPHFIARLKRTR